MRPLFIKAINVSVKPLRYGTLLEISRLYARIGVNAAEMPDNAHLMLSAHALTVCRVAAVCALNHPLKIKWLAAPMARWLLSVATPGQILEMMLFMTSYANYDAFTATIRLIGDMRVTTPKNLSHGTQGSQQLQD